jgi:hypothetical protein
MKHSSYSTTSITAADLETLFSIIACASVTCGLTAFPVLYRLNDFLFNSSEDIWGILAEDVPLLVGVPNSPSTFCF